MRFTEEFERALAAVDPIKDLRAFAMQLSASGYKRREIYQFFLAFYVFLQDERRGHHENVMGDVMDMIVDRYPPHNMSLPE